MRRWYLLILLLIPSILIAKWTDADYEKYNILTFTNYQNAKKYIDFSNIDYALLHAMIFYHTNIEREKHNRIQFKYSKLLTQAAFDYAKEMVIHNFFSHYHPYNSEKYSMKKRLSALGFRNVYISENIARSFGIQYQAGRSVYSPAQNGGYFSYSYKGDPIPAHTYITFAQIVVKQWMNSPGHRANILASKSRFLGCGAYYYKDSSFYNIATFKCVQNFSSVRGY